MAPQQNVQRMRDLRKDLQRLNGITDRITKNGSITVSLLDRQPPFDKADVWSLVHLHMDCEVLPVSYDSLGAVVPSHAHSVTEIIVQIEGRVQYRFDDGEQIVLAPKETLTIPPGRLHIAEALSHPCHQIAILIPAAGEIGVPRAEQIG